MVVTVRYFGVYFLVNVSSLAVATPDGVSVCTLLADELLDFLTLPDLDW